MRGFLIGRFQPFHLGHIHVINEILKEDVDEIIIGIGSAQRSHSLDDPFTAGERLSMIAKSLFEEGTGKPSYIIPINDVNNNSLWMSHVLSLTPPFHRVYSGNPLVKRLFKEKGFDVVTLPLYNREEYSGTEIRNRILEGKDWKSLVPGSVVDIIEEVDGIQRIKDLALTDTV